jgi:hypothetical protein
LIFAPTLFRSSPFYKKSVCLWRAKEGDTMKNYRILLRAMPVIALILLSTVSNGRLATITRRKSAGKWGGGGRRQ